MSRIEKNGDIRLIPRNPDEIEVIAVHEGPSYTSGPKWSFHLRSSGRAAVIIALLLGIAAGYLLVQLIPFYLGMS
jgi:hypothetical protein